MNAGCFARTATRLAFGSMLLVASTTLLAQGGSPPGHGSGPIPFDVYDQDGDGSVSEAEFAAAREKLHAEMAAQGRPMKGMAGEPGFTDLDADGDGKLSMTELESCRQPGPQAGLPCPGMQGQGMGPGRGPGPGMPAFGDIDTNGDGCISPEEFAAHHAMHQGHQP